MLVRALRRAMSALTGSAPPPSVLPLAASFPPPPPSFQPLAALDSIPVGISKATLPPGSADEPLVVVREASGALHVMHGLCAHKKGELHLGDLEEIGGRLCLTCPRHRKKFPGGLSFDVCSGEASQLEAAKDGVNGVRPRARPVAQPALPPSHTSLAQKIGRCDG